MTGPEPTLFPLQGPPPAGTAAQDQGAGFALWTPQPPPPGGSPSYLEKTGVDTESQYLAQRPVSITLACPFAPLPSGGWST